MKLNKTNKRYLRIGAAVLAATLAIGTVVAFTQIGSAEALNTGHWKSTCRV